MINFKKIAFGALLVASASAMATTPMHFEYSWEGFTNTAGGPNGEAFYRAQYYTPSSNTGPNGGAEGSEYFVFFETSSGAAYDAGDYAVLQSGTTTAKVVSFYYHMYGADTGTLAVDVYNGYTWERVWELSGQQQTSSNAAWIQQTLDISNFTSSKKIRFFATAVGGYLGDIGIDEIRFEGVPEATLGYQYDALGRLICVEDSMNGNRQYDYDAAGNRNNVSVNTCGN